MKIGKREIELGKPTFILAEAGTNHLGRTGLAMDHVDAAWIAGCNGVKFQLFTKSELFCPMQGDERRKERWDKSVMSLEEWQKVRGHARRRGIDFILSAFQLDGVDMANELEIDAYKVASRAAPTFPFEMCKGPFIVSNGLGPVSYPEGTLELNCVMKYPAPLKECLWDGSFSGISDHSGTVWPAIDACFRGAEMVEVHFALNDAGPDKAVCLTPEQLKLICEARDAAASMQTD